MINNMNNDIFISYKYNPEYYNKNNIYSFWLAKNEMNEDFILLNGDVLFHPDILSSILEAKRSSLAIDDDKMLGPEEMKVVLNSKKQIIDIGKDLDPLKSQGEYIGLMKILKRDIPYLISYTDCLIKNGMHDVFYEEALRYLVRRRKVLFGVSINKLPWIEVDYLVDLNKAKSQILPNILNSISSINKNFKLI